MKLKNRIIAFLFSLMIIFAQFTNVHAADFSDVGNNVLRIGNDIYSVSSEELTNTNILKSWQEAGNNKVYYKINGNWFDVLAAKSSSYFFDSANAIEDQTVNSWQGGMFFKSDGSTEEISSGDGGDSNPSNSVISVYSTGNTSVEVAFKNALEATAYVKGKFGFNNGLTVQNSNIKSGNKTVVLTTSSQDSNKTYTLTYDGKAVSETFKGTAAGTTVPPAPSIPSTPVDDDNKLQGLDSKKAYQYKEVGSDNWMDYNPESGLPENVEGKDILVREKGTATTPPGVPIEVNVPGDPKDGDTQRSITKVVAYNGGSEIDTVTVMFDKSFFPSENVYLSDFEVKRSIDAGAYSGRLSTANLKISADKKSASFGVQSVSKQMDEQSVKYSVSYKGAGAVDAGSAVTVPAVLTHIESYSIKAIKFAGNNLHEIKVTVKSGVANVKVNGKIMNYKGSKEFILYTTELVGQSSAQIKLYASDGSELESKTINVPFS